MLSMLGLRRRCIQRNVADREGWGIAQADMASNVLLQKKQQRLPISAS